MLLILSDVSPWVLWALSSGTVVRSDGRLCIFLAGLDGLNECTAKLVLLSLPNLFLEEYPLDLEVRTLSLMTLSSLDSSALWIMERESRGAFPFLLLYCTVWVLINFYFIFLLWVY